MESRNHSARWHRPLRIAAVRCFNDRTISNNEGRKRLRRWADCDLLGRNNGRICCEGTDETEATPANRAKMAARRSTMAVLLDRIEDVSQHRGGERAPLTINQANDWRTIMSLSINKTYTNTYPRSVRCPCTEWSMTLFAIHQSVEPVQDAGRFVFQDIGF